MTEQAPRIEDTSLQNTLLLGIHSVPLIKVYSVRLVHIGVALSFQVTVLTKQQVSRRARKSEE